MFSQPAFIVKRGELIAPDYTGPVYLCTTNDALPAVLASCPPSRRSDLVVTQNGWLQPLLAQHQLTHTTQALLYFSAHYDGTVVDGKRSVVWGRWAGHVCDALQRGGVTCREVQHYSEFLEAAVEKLMWSTIFWLLCDACGSITVGEAVDNHWSDVRALTAELLPIMHTCLLASEDPACKTAASHLDLQLLLAGLHEYSMSIRQARPSRTMALKELSWRNGFFLTEGRGQDLLHRQWLEQANVALA